ncbi:hypothetical protein K8O96_02985 [Clostridium sporogenes]|uniref:Uncharacterized protein n=1 Tax=Clostridium botulinum TaxID=1491 RepID=A0A6M0T1J6_CLOBO|nr:hypothetical protein [Clostridium sporogenes]NFA60810.1 hypothetical protein [Clostridium botulinum]NFI72517.1 hypothetical protein [Clostridium sporogenes]NFM23585.1 hypothetical protein [Clostridium sporogenes]NFP60635.1 hypothetical protein [Clostridium sporogenes]NFU93812.1 hypothetical protein [Clostridium sporogenes]
MKRLKEIQNIDIIILISNILLIICFINLKHYSVSNIITIMGLIFFSLAYAYNHESVRNYIRKLIYGQQYKIMYNIDKIIKDNKKNDIKITLNEIKYYYDNPNNSHSIEEYLSRAYKLENNYSGVENLKYSVLAGVVMLAATELPEALRYNLSKNKNDYSLLVLGIASIFIFILIVIFILAILKMLSFSFFYPTIDKGLNKVINDIEREIVNKKIKQFIN